MNEPFQPQRKQIGLIESNLPKVPPTSLARNDSEMARGESCPYYACCWVITRAAGFQSCQVTLGKEPRH